MFAYGVSSEKAEHLVRDTCASSNEEHLSGDRCMYSSAARDAALSSFVPGTTTVEQYVLVFAPPEGSVRRRVHIRVYVLLGVVQVEKAGYLK